MTSLIIWGLEGLIFTLKCFKMTISKMEELEVNMLLLPDREVHDNINIEEGWLIALSDNLLWFP